ncbi:hypothetical protein PR048_007031 [Dryococelus australis]|uniref:Uncharacterized protein n=1 Tax=Dryococelus australis TaxID=614101 RepID=A0ABQ9ICI8_9NEOP|nr:hypothetical protein PR048_007031 [Dryococelus australis]
MPHFLQLQDGMYERARASPLVFLAREPRPLLTFGLSTTHHDELRLTNQRCRSPGNVAPVAGGLPRDTPAVSHDHPTKPVTTKYRCEAGPSQDDYTGDKRCRGSRRGHWNGRRGGTGLMRPLFLLITSPLFLLLCGAVTSSPNNERDTRTCSLRSRGDTGSSPGTHGPQKENTFSFINFYFVSDFFGLIALEMQSSEGQARAKCVGFTQRPALFLKLRRDLHTPSFAQSHQMGHGQRCKTATPRSTEWNLSRSRMDALPRSGITASSLTELSNVTTRGPPTTGVCLGAASREAIVSYSLTRRYSGPHATPCPNHRHAQSSVIRTPYQRRQVELQRNATAGGNRKAPRKQAGRRQPPLRFRMTPSSLLYGGGGGGLAVSLLAPPPKANRIQSPAGSLPDFRKWYSCRTMPLIGGFSRRPRATPPRHSGAAPYSLRSPSSALKTSLLRVAQISSLTPAAGGRGNSFRNCIQTISVTKPSST